MLTPDAIQKKEFEQSVLGGYRRDEVDVFLDQLEEDYGKLYAENTELVEKLKVCLAKIEDYKKDEEFLKTAIINAQKLNETTLREIELREKEAEMTSKTKAAEIIAEAEEQAKAIVLKAEQESADAVRSAREQCKAEIDAEQKKADEKIARIRLETGEEQKKLDHLRSQVAEFKNTIIDLYKAHLTSISKLPDFKAEAEEEIAVPAPAKTPEPAPAAVEEPAPEEPVAAPEEVADAPAEERDAEGNTVEFKLEEKSVKKEEEPKPAAKSHKFENLKFGVDYDINKDN